MNPELKNAICPHRGLGDENSLTAIERAVGTKPFMVEFDIQRVGGKFCLGHPPVVRYQQTLSDALGLFSGTGVLPKTDVKCSLDWSVDVDLLVAEVSAFGGRALFNIGGEKLSSRQFMEAEKYFLDNTDPSFLLNIDISRYSGIDSKQQQSHISCLSRKPFSISPMLEGEYDAEIKIALDCGIENLHFWSNGKQKYGEADLLALYRLYRAEGVSVYFDINPNIII